MAKYVEITRDEFEDFIVNAQMFRRLDPNEIGHVCGEEVYELPMNSGYAPGCKIRIYSSISRKGVGRDAGADAIRVVLVDPEGYPWMKALKRVHRVKGWRANVLDRYERVLNEPWHYRWQAQYPCPKCSDGTMRCRWGRKGSFMGCSNYNPNATHFKLKQASCRHTEMIYTDEEVVVLGESGEWPDGDSSEAVQ